MPDLYDTSFNAAQNSNFYWQQLIQRENSTENIYVIRCQVWLSAHGDFLIIRSSGVGCNVVCSGSDIAEHWRGYGRPSSRGQQ